MKRIHLICKEGKGLSVTSFPTYESREWDLREDDAKQLIGGMICFHETKSEPSYFGGIVKGYRVEMINAAHSKRIIFILDAAKEAKQISWSGIDHVNAWYSGLVQVG